MITARHVMQSTQQVVILVRRLARVRRHQLVSLLTRITTVCSQSSAAVSGPCMECILASSQNALVLCTFAPGLRRTHDCPRAGKRAGFLVPSSPAATWILVRIGAKYKGTFRFRLGNALRTARWRLTPLMPPSDSRFPGRRFAGFPGYALYPSAQVPLARMGWIERIPGDTRQKDGLETGIMGGGLRPRH